MTLDYQALLEAARRAARDAGSAVLEIAAGHVETRHKTDQSPVTIADDTAERIILAALRQAAPDIPIVSEEDAAATGLPAGPAARYWLVDPVDGTRGFIERRDEYTVNIGLVENGRAVLGVIGVPTRGLIYAACGAGTATRQQGDARPEPISARLPPPQPIVLSSRFYGASRRLTAYLDAIPGAENRQMGSAVKFCILAEGGADYYPRFGETCEWDTAAGQAILEAAGGSVRTLDGAPLAYGKSKFLNPAFVARGRT